MPGGGRVQGESGPGKRETFVGRTTVLLSTEDELSPYSPATRFFSLIALLPLLVEHMLHEKTLGRLSSFKQHMQ